MILTDSDSYLKIISIIFARLKNISERKFQSSTCTSFGILRRAILIGPAGTKFPNFLPENHLFFLNLGISIIRGFIKKKHRTFQYVICGGITKIKIKIQIQGIGEFSARINGLFVIFESCLRN